MRGYTLIEAVLVILIVSILAAFVAPVLSTAVSSYDVTTRNIEVMTKMRYAMERMAREIRQVRRDPVNSAEYDIASMTATNFQFCKADNTRVRINYTSPNVGLAYTAGFTSTCTPAAVATQVLTDQVTSPPANPFTFTYRLANGNPGATRANVAFVDIDMTITGTGTGAYTNTMRVDLRVP